MQINWTGIIGSIVIALSFLVVGWLTPSPFDKKVKDDTNIVAIDYIPGHEDSTFVLQDPIVLKDTTKQKKPVILIQPSPSDTTNFFEDIFLFEKLTQDTTEDGTSYAFRSSTYYNPIDSSSFTIHEINIEPRGLQSISRVDTMKVVEVQYVEKPVTFSDNKYTWGIVGVIIGEIGRAHV